MKSLITLLLIALLVGCKSAPTKSVDAEAAKKSTIEKTANNQVDKNFDYNVKADNLRETITYLASDALKGRDTGTEGIDTAAKFLENKLSSFGVQPYFDSFRDNFKVGNLDAFNVVGVIEGNDSELKDQFIVIGAHYDHIGVINPENGDSIANGANDNASGSATILEIARYFGKNKTNKRSLIFAFFSAEEKGLQGSKHLGKRLKEKGIDLYTMINFEMTGVPFVGRDYTAFLTGYDLSNMSEKMNAYANENLIGKSEVAVKYNLFKRSDNYAFYQEFKVPSHTFSTCDLTNFDHYHKVGDESEVLDYPHMASLATKVIPIIEGISNASTKEIVMNGK